MSDNAGFSFPDSDPLTDRGTRPAAEPDRSSASEPDVKRFIVERRTSIAMEEPTVEGLDAVNEATQGDWSIRDISIAERFETDPSAGRVVTRFVFTLQRKGGTRSLFDFGLAS